MTHKYLVQCWITPRSGFDIVKKNRVLEFFRSVVSEALSDEYRAEESIRNFEESHEGLILEPIIVESDTEVMNAQKEILPEIQKVYPGAVIFSCTLIPVSVVA